MVPDIGEPAELVAVLGSAGEIIGYVHSWLDTLQPLPEVNAD